jgi:transposase
VLLATRHSACAAKVSAINQLKAPIVAAQVLVSWSHAGRLRSEAAFAALAGANPIPASSGQVIRHRLNRGGDRQLFKLLGRYGHAAVEVLTPSKPV